MTSAPSPDTMKGTDKKEDKRMERKKIGILTGILVVALLLLGVAAWLLFGRGEEPIVPDVPGETEQDCTDQNWTVEDFEAYQAEHPNTTVLWNVPIADTTVLSNATEASLPHFDAEDFARLTYLPNLEKLDLTGCTDADVLSEALREALPNCEINDTARSSTDEGWREHVRYEWIRKMFKEYVWVEMPTQ